MTSLQIAIGKARSIGTTRLDHPSRRARQDAARQVFGALPTPEQFAAALAEADRQCEIRQRRLAARLITGRWCAGRILYLAESRARERAIAAETARRQDTTTIRRRVLAELRRLGFRREHTSGRSAYYYQLQAGLTVRVSDHAVPLTAEREWSLANGGRSWAASSLSLVVGECDERDWLDDVRGAIAARMEAT